MTTDDEKVRGIAPRAAAWWDRAKVTVMGLSIIGAVIGTTFALGATQAEITAQIAALSEKVIETRDTVRAITGRLDEHGESIARMSERLGRLETQREEQARNIQLFWAKDWADLKLRVERIEQVILHSGRPSVRDGGER